MAVLTGSLRFYIKGPDGFYFFIPELYPQRVAGNGVDIDNAAAPGKFAFPLYHGLPLVIHIHKKRAEAFRINNFTFPDIQHALFQRFPGLNLLEHRPERRDDQHWLFPGETLQYIETLGIIEDLFSILFILIGKESNLVPKIRREEDMQVFIHGLCPVLRGSQVEQRP